MTLPHDLLKSVCQFMEFDAKRRADKREEDLFKKDLERLKRNYLASRDQVLTLRNTKHPRTIFHAFIKQQPIQSHLFYFDIPQLLVLLCTEGES